MAKIPGISITVDETVVPGIGNFSSHRVVVDFRSVWSSSPLSCYVASAF
jgi:hypothetical protein